MQRLTNVLGNAAQDAAANVDDCGCRSGNAHAKVKEATLLAMHKVQPPTLLLSCAMIGRNFVTRTAQYQYHCIITL